MKKNSMCIVILVVLSFGLGIVYSKISKKCKLDKHYLSCFKSVKERLLFGSEVDTRTELEDYEDRVELYMHLDGYDAVQILSMKTKALSEVSKGKLDEKK